MEKEVLEKLSKMYESVRNTIVEYNKLAKDKNAPTRMGMVFRDVEEQYENYIEYEELDEKMSYEDYINNTCEPGGSIYAPGADEWFPSDITC